MNSRDFVKVLRTKLNANIQRFEIILKSGNVGYLRWILFLINELRFESFSFVKVWALIKSKSRHRYVRRLIEHSNLENV